MKLLPKGTHARRMRCSTSAVSTSKYCMYGLSEKSAPKPKPKPPPPLALAGAGVLLADGNEDACTAGGGASGTRYATLCG